jgi:hypothetical protein
MRQFYTGHLDCVDDSSVQDCAHEMPAVVNNASPGGTTTASGSVH